MVPSAAAGEWEWIATDQRWTPPALDGDRPTAARIYDYALGGKDHFAPDRSALGALGELGQEFRDVSMAGRGFLVRAVDAIARTGVEQFIDLGSGLPHAPEVHEVAAASCPRPAVVYVDNDPIVTTHNRALLGGHPGVGVLHADLRDPDAVLTAPELRSLVDLSRPVALLMTSALQFVRADLAGPLLRSYCERLPTGSVVALSLISCEQDAAPAAARLQRAFADTPTPLVVHSAAEIADLLTPLTLWEPGLSDVARWRDEAAATVATGSVRALAAVGSVG